MSDGVTFYFMRHGETYFNRLERMQGWSNALLTEEGRKEVQQSGRGLSDIRFEAIYTSDLARTIETAEIVLAENHYAQDLSIRPMKEFREVHFGSFEGLPAHGIWREVSEEVQHKHHLPQGSDREMEFILNKLHKKDPNGWAENYVTFWNRVESGLLQLLYKHAGTGKDILVVAHGLTIRNLIHGLVADFNPKESPPLDNASISKVKYVNGQFELLTYNQTDHFLDS